MAEPDALLAEVGKVFERLSDLGLQPVLVGGMALVIRGSRRVTRDFDFVVERPGKKLDALLGGLYGRGLELASRIDSSGEVTATIDNRKVAGVRLRVDAPASASFVNPKTGLRVDLLFDFPLPAKALAERATTVRARSSLLRVASEADLLRLKKIARKSRRLTADAEDISFLEGRRSQRR